MDIYLCLLLAGGAYSHSVPVVFFYGWRDQDSPPRESYEEEGLTLASLPPSLSLSTPMSGIKVDLHIGADRHLGGGSLL